jgi:S1-C subfamily serine protease
MKRFATPLILGVCAYLGGLSAIALTTSRGLPSLWAQAPAANADAGPAALRELNNRFETVARKLSPSVVALEAVKPATKAGQSRTVDDSGSGVLVRLPGRSGVFVLTNNHVIGKAAPERITVNLSDSRILKPVRVHTDPESDIAILALNSDQLPTATLGDSDRMRVGMWVLAFGSPFGLNQTVTHGIISARERGQVSLGSTIRIKDFLQTDASINPGSSGGPLVNLDGEVIGINTAIASPSGSNTGIAFSIPINMVKKIAAQLLDNGRVTRGYLGVQLAAGFESADAIKLGLARAQGALVDGAHPNTPAAAAGLRRSDVILELDGVPIRNENHLINTVSNLPPGQKVRLKVWRERRAVVLDATVGDWSKAEPRFRK